MEGKYYGHFCFLRCSTSISLEMQGCNCAPPPPLPWGPLSPMGGSLPAQLQLQHPNKVGPASFTEALVLPSHLRRYTGTTILVHTPVHKKGAARYLQRGVCGQSGGAAGRLQQAYGRCDRWTVASETAAYKHTELREHVK